MSIPYVTDLGFSKKKKPPPTRWGAADVEASLAANPGGTFGPSAGVDYAGLQFGMGGGAPPSLKIPGYDPDYSALLQGDPSVIAAQGDLGAFEGQLEGGRRAAIRRAVIAAGLSPGSALADVDEQTILSANQNQFSGRADLDRQRMRGDSDLGAALASRGLTFSGGQQSGGQRIQEGYERGTTSLTQQLLDQIAGYEADFTGKLGSVRAQYNALKEQAALRVQADPRYQPVGENDAILDPATGLYMTPDGRWYNQDGTRVSPLAAGAPAAAAVPPPAAVVAPPPLPAGGLVANPQMTIEEFAALARVQPDFYESDNRMAAAGRSGRVY